MAVQLNPRSIPVQGAQASQNVHSVPSGVASAPSSIVSQASDTGGFCGWIVKLCEWIKSLFCSNPFEERVQKGKELIDRAFSVFPECNPDRTVMACELRYNNQVTVSSRILREANGFKEECYARLSDLLRRNENIENDTLTVNFYFCEKLPDGIYFNTTHRRQGVDFTHGDASEAGEPLFTVCTENIRGLLNPQVLSAVVHALVVI